MYDHGLTIEDDRYCVLFLKEQFPSQNPAKHCRGQLLEAQELGAEIWERAS